MPQLTEEQKQLMMEVQQSRTVFFTWRQPYCDWLSQLMMEIQQSGTVFCA